MITTTHKTMKRVLVLLAAIVAVLVAGSFSMAAKPAHAAPATFTVNSTADPGDGICDASECTLREAMDTADTNGNPQETDIINFNIPGEGPHTIKPNTALDEIQTPVIIDGYTQPGASPNTLAKGTNAKIMIELDGSNTGGGDGFYTDSENTVIRGLAINRFSGGGIEVQAPAQNNVKIEGNFIGSDPSGTQDLGNGGYGVEFMFGSGLTVGGTTPAARNLISGNQKDGLSLWNTTGNTISGNLIGTKSDGTSALGNTGNGVTLVGTSNNLIGGGTPASANTIAFNAKDGVVVLDSLNNSNYSSDGNRILSNSIFTNGGLGIDLLGPNEDYATNVSAANDILDPDLGPNDLQNFPVVTSAKASRRGTAIKGTLNSTPHTVFVVQLFSNPTGDAEGKTFIAETSVATDASGNASFTLRAKRVSGVVTATATNFSSGDTSEFSAPKKVVRLR
jgi:CSLREA domain-containing protein